MTVLALAAGPPREQKWPGEKAFMHEIHKNIVGIVNYITVFDARQSVCHESITDYSTEVFTYESRQCNVKRKKREQHEDAAQKGKNHENKSLMGPLKSLGAPQKYLLSSPPFSVGLPSCTLVLEG